MWCDEVSDFVYWCLDRHTTAMRKGTRDRRVRGEERKKEGRQAVRNRAVVVVAVAEGAAGAGAESPQD